MSLPTSSDDSGIERALTWTTPADASGAEGVTPLTTGIEPADDSYNFTGLAGKPAERVSRH